MRVFVYGSLKRGHYNNRHLDGATYLGEYRTPPKYALYDLGPFPAMTEADRGVSVQGEVYLIDSKTLDRLDRLEGHPRFYERKTMMCGKYGRCLVYLLSQGDVPHDSTLIENGVWNDV